jgi:raffinose/stachyose/melibiose transport system permease protein
MATTSLTLRPRAAAGGAPAGRVLSRILVYAAAVLVLLVTGLPYLFMFVTALKAPNEFILNLWGLPRGVALGNFADAIASGFGRYFVNSVLVSVVSVVLTILLASLASYPLARMRFRLGRPLFLLFLAGSMIPVHVTLIPVYVLSKGLGIYDSLWALFGPYIGFQLPISVFILTEFFRGIPREIEEAARIDGAGTLGIFARIIMPLSAPAISTVAIYAFIFVWNEFIFALVLLSSPANMTIPLGLMQFFGEYRVNVPGLMAVLTLASLPVIVLYLVAQNRVVAGLTAGAVKG